MAGLAKTTDFQFSLATVLIGPQTALNSLTPALHSVGLVKNVMLEASPKLVELGQGLTNDIVASFVNQIDVKVSMEVYEYTAQNFAYGLSLDGTTGSSLGITTKLPPVALAAAVAAGATTFTMTGDQTTAFIAGTWGYLQEGTDDYVHDFKVISSAFAASTTTVTITGYPVPVGMSFSTANGRAGTTNKISADSSISGNTFLCAKIRGLTSTSRTPVTVVIPKMKILKGFSLHFDNSAFGNMPFEFTPYVPLPTDTTYYSEFAQRMTVLK